MDYGISWVRSFQPGLRILVAYPLLGGQISHGMGRDLKNSCQRGTLKVDFKSPLVLLHHEKMGRATRWNSNHFQSKWDGLQFLTLLYDALHLSTPHLWSKHAQRVGHINLDSIDRLVKDNILPSLVVKQLLICEFCLEGKMTKRQFSSKGNRAKDLSELVHTDVHGPMNVKKRKGWFWVFHHFHRGLLNVWTHISDTP